MSNDISAEINKGIAIKGTAREMRRAREKGERIVVVAGPAVVHSGGEAHLARLVRDGWVDALLTGNAFAVHDLGGLPVVRVGGAAEELCDAEHESQRDHQDQRAAHPVDARRQVASRPDHGHGKTVCAETDPSRYATPTSPGSMAPVRLSGP